MSTENKMTKLEAYNEVVSAIRRAEYVDSTYADSVDVRALTMCESVLRERMASEKKTAKNTVIARAAR